MFSFLSSSSSSVNSVTVNPTLDRPQQQRFREQQRNYNSFSSSSSSWMNILPPNGFVLFPHFLCETTFVRDQLGAAVRGV